MKSESKSKSAAELNLKVKYIKPLENEKNAEHKIEFPFELTQANANVNEKYIDISLIDESANKIDKNELGNAVGATCGFIPEMCVALCSCTSIICCLCLMIFILLPIIAILLLIFLPQIMNLTGNG